MESASVPLQPYKRVAQWIFYAALLLSALALVTNYFLNESSRRTPSSADSKTLSLLSSTK